MRWLLIFILIPLFFSACHSGQPKEKPLVQRNPVIKQKPARIVRSKSIVAEKPSGTPSLKKMPDMTSKPGKRRIRKTVEPPPDLNVAPEIKILQDSILRQRIEYLRTQPEEIDLNEPINRGFLHPFPYDIPPATLILRGSDRILKINFDNDILDYTDRFYTNGIRIDYTAPVFQKNPLSKLMIPYWAPATNYYGISLVQNMYTPSTTKTGGIMFGDRPYAAYLFFGSFKITNDPLHRFRQTGEIDLGVIGPYSFGDWVQTAFHKTVPSNNEPLGWEYQVQNDVILNYHLSFEKGIVAHKVVDLNLISGSSLGTLYTNLTGGFQFRTGWLNPYFANLGVARKPRLERLHLRKTQFFFFLKGTAKLVGYDATLQGGLFNRSSVYTIASHDISRLVVQSSAGISFSHGGIRLDLEQFVLSPEFADGSWHKWVHIGLSFCL